MESKADDRIEVAIVGGGICGLCTAIGLLKHSHIKVTVYEAAEQFSEIGAGVLLEPNARRALRLISPEADSDMEKLSTGNGSAARKHEWYDFKYSSGPRAGQRLVKVENELGQSSFHRARFLDILLRLVPHGICHLSKRLQAIEESATGVTLRFKDCTSTQAHCVLGADGVRSEARHCLFKDDWEDYEPRFSGVAAFRAPVLMHEAKEIVGNEIATNSFTHCGPNTVISSFPIDFGETFNVVACRTDLKDWEGPWVKRATFDQVEEAFK